MGRAKYGGTPTYTERLSPGYTGPHKPSLPPLSMAKANWFVARRAREKQRMGYPLSGNEKAALLYWENRRKRERSGQ